MPTLTYSQQDLVTVSIPGKEPLVAEVVKSTEEYNENSQVYVICRQKELIRNLPNEGKFWVSIKYCRKIRNV